MDDRVEEGRPPLLEVQSDLFLGVLRGNLLALPVVALIFFFAGKVLFATIWGANIVLALGILILSVRYSMKSTASWVWGLVVGVVMGYAMYLLMAMILFTEGIFLLFLLASFGGVMIPTVIMAAILGYLVIRHVDRKRSGADVRARPTERRAAEGDEGEAMREEVVWMEEN